MTAVEIFFNDLVNLGFIEYKDDSLVQNIFNAALEIEKQQIKDAYDHHRCIGNFDNGEEYFNETYKKE
jgi:hypothetical protein